MTLLDNCRSYLREISDTEDLGLSEQQIEQHAQAMAEVLVTARNAYMSDVFG